MTPDRYLIYPSIEFVRQTVTKHGLALSIPVVIDGSYIFEADFTTADVRTDIVLLMYLLYQGWPIGRELPAEFSPKVGIPNHRSLFRQIINWSILCYTKWKTLNKHTERITLKIFILRLAKISNVTFFDWYIILCVIITKYCT